MESRRFCPGDIVQISGGLSSFEYLTGDSTIFQSVGSLLFGDKTGVIIRTVKDGYDVDFGKYIGGCVSVPESLLVRA